MSERQYEFSFSIDVPLDDKDEYEQFCAMMGVEPVYLNGNPAVVSEVNL